jgi:hypothetical protein
MMIRLFGQLLLMLSCALTVFARPVSYPGGVTVMSHNDYMANALSANYTISSRDTVGLLSEYDRNSKYWYHAAQYVNTVKRWNQEDSQANLYLIIGAGIAEVRDNSELGGNVGLSTDWEDRKFYVSYENHLKHVESQTSFFHETARVGIAPYVGSYQDLQTWLMLQIDHTPQLSDEFVTTGLVRMFYYNYLVEFGVSDNERVLMNFMTYF